MRTKRTQTRQEEIASGGTVPTLSPVVVTGSSVDCIGGAIGANLRNKPSPAMLKRSATSAAAACRENSPAKVLRKPVTTNVGKSDFPNNTPSEIDKKSGNKSISTTKSNVATTIIKNVSEKNSDKKVKKGDGDKVSMPKVKKLTKKDILKNKQIAAKALAAANAAAASASATASTAVTETVTSGIIVTETDDKPPSSPKDEKVSKELKNLDIQITGFNSVLKCDSNTSSSDIIIKASISEIVKTKSRTSASQSIYGKSATMTAATSAATALLTNSCSASVTGTNTSDKAIIKSDSAIEQTIKVDEVKLDENPNKPTSSTVKKGKVIRKNIATKKKANNKKKKEVQEELPCANQNKNSAEVAISAVLDDTEKSASTKKRINAEKSPPKNKKQKITDTKANANSDAQNDLDVLETNLTDIQSSSQIPLVDKDKDLEIDKNVETESVKEKDVVNVTPTNKPKIGKKNAKKNEKDTPKKTKPQALKKGTKKDTAVDGNLIDCGPINDGADKNLEGNPNDKKTKKPVTVKKKPVKTKATKKSKIVETVVKTDIKATIEKETIAETPSPPSSSTNLEPVTSVIVPTISEIVLTKSVTDSPASSPKHQKGKEATAKKPQKENATDEIILTKGKTKIACPKKKILKALKITEEETKSELSVDTETIDCEASESVNIASQKEPIAFDSPSILELTEDTSQIESTSIPNDTIIPHVSTGSLSDLIANPDQSPIRSQSNIKKMVEDILQVLEMSDEFSGNETVEKKPPTVVEENPADDSNEVKKLKPVKEKVAKTLKPSKSKKPTANKSKSDSIPPEIATETEVRYEEVSSDEALSNLVKCEEKSETKSETKPDNSEELGTATKDEPDKKVKILKKTANKKIPMVSNSLIVKRKYVRKKPKSPTALQKMVDKAVKKKQKITLTEAEISALDCVEDYSRTKDIYDFHESGHSSEDTSLSYKKNMKKDPKICEQKTDWDKTDPLEISEKSIKDHLIDDTEKEDKPDADELTETDDTKQHLKEIKAKKCSTPTKTKKSKETQKITKVQSPKKSATHIKKKDPPPKATKKKKSQIKHDKSTHSTSDSEPISKKKMTTEKETKSKNKQKAKQKKVPAKKYRSKYDSSNESDSEDEESSDGDEVLAKKYYNTKRLTTDTSNSTESDSESCTSVRTRVNKRRKAAVKNRRMRLFGFYSGPKRHRMASLNALAKVQCLYENESRTAQELGFVREPRVVPKVVTAKTRASIVIVPNENEDVDDEDGSGSENEEDDAEEDVGCKVGTSKKKMIPKDPLSETDVKIESEVIGSRSLRTAPGIRGAGKLWEMGNMSSMESNTGGESDESYEQHKAEKPKVKKKPLPKRSAPKPKSTEKPKVKQTKIKPKKPPPSSRSNTSDTDDNSDAADGDDDSPSPIKSKKVKKTVEKTELVSSKRMASLNASAILAASYEVERHFDRCDSLYTSSDNDSVKPKKQPQQQLPPQQKSPLTVKPMVQSPKPPPPISIPSPKKIEKIKDEIEDPKEMSRPVSTNVLIVQDTDVTITGVYVNASLGSSQEAYCKMQYRVQSSVTEERVVRPTPQDPPKSYTPLSALSCMLPPGTNNEAAGIVEPPPTNQLRQPIPLQQATYTKMSPQHYPSTQQYLPMHHRSPSECESPFRYQQLYQPQSVVPTIPSQSMAQSSSAFCAIPQSHHDTTTGYYQPAGPLISSHLQQGSTKTIPTPLDSDSIPLQQPPQSTSAAESSDSEVLITGADLTPRPQTFRYAPQSAGPYARPMHQMHCPTYPPATYYAPYSQHPQDMCYSPPYPYYPSKIYPTSYRRYVTPNSYYPPAPNDMYDPPPPTSAQAPPPPPSGTQIVPAGPSGPQHIDHYPQYYPGYSPGGGQCYSRSMQPPYMDATPYQNSCPCPVQTCPKNVHTGPLIGSSKTSKGPVQSTNHHTAPTIIDNAAMTVNLHQPQTTSIMVGGTPIVSSTSVIGGITCKLEDGPIVVKPEAVDAHLYMHSIANDVRGEKAYDNLHAVHAPHPNFSLNSKILEPETSISPARGSTGLPMPQPTQGTATQPAEQQQHGMIRRARVGKSMAREMMMQPHHHPHHHHHHHGNGGDGRGGGSAGSTTSVGVHHHVLHSQTHLDTTTVNSIDSQTFNGTSNKSKDHLSIGGIEIKQEVDLIKKEDMKVECDDDVVLLLEKPDEPIQRISLIDTTNKMNNFNNFTSLAANSKSSNTNVDRDSVCQSSVHNETEIINLIDNSPDDDDEDDDYHNTPVNVRKRKILELNRHQCKKSPPNSYKSLIKQSEPKPYLCTAEPKRTSSTSSGTNQSMPKRSRYRLIKSGQRYRTQQRKIIINGKHKKLLITSNKKIKRRILKRKIINRDPLPSQSLQQHSIQASQSIDLTTSSIDGDDMDAVDHQSTESLSIEIDSPAMTVSTTTVTTPISPSSTQSSIVTTTTTTSTITTAAVMVAATNVDSSNNQIDQRQSSEKQLFMSKLELLTDADAAAVIAEKRKRCASDENLSLMILNRIQLNDRRRSKSESKRCDTIVRDRSKSASKSKDCKSLSEQQKRLSLCDKKKLSIATKKGKKSTSAASQKGVDNSTMMILDDNDSIINNNNIMYDNNNKMFHQNQQQQQYPHQPANNRSTGGKKTKSRGAKFSSKKRRRVRHVQEIEEIVIPRRTSAVPRWSNGWHWEGPSFRGKVFLNSDDLPVVRTRYLCMRHDSGDVIQPGDSVLLKAGSKRNELPYVAKVASLWENPEDGEMMMSLLWYYRPEHTEQGRQPNDCVDEVFASKHQDHNSVACIEDKCYVLTFNEYCRYRKAMKAIEDNVPEVKPFAPLLSASFESREVPPNTSAELVFFCRRVYEFRLKRLIKNPS